MAWHSLEKNFETMWLHMHTLDRFIFEPWKVSLPLTGLCRMTGPLPLSKKNPFNASFKARPIIDSNGDSKCYLGHSDLRRHSFRTRVVHNSKFRDMPHLNTFRKLSSGKSGKQPVQQPVQTGVLYNWDATRVCTFTDICVALRGFSRQIKNKQTFESWLTFLSNMPRKIKLRIKCFLIRLKSKMPSGLVLTPKKSQNKRKKRTK